jgi:PRC-barrel domain
MGSESHLLREIRRVAAGYRRNRLAALHVAGGALVIAIATAANPATSQSPAPGASSATELSGSSLMLAVPDGATRLGLRLWRSTHADLFRILGKEIRGASGEKMGRVVDVLFDQTGRPRAAIIDFGGFLGVGIRKIAIDWSTLRFDKVGQKDAIVTDLDRDQIKAAPEYKESHEIVAIVTEPRPEASDPGW